MKQDHGKIRNEQQMCFLHITSSLEFLREKNLAIYYDVCQVFLFSKIGSETKLCEYDCYFDLCPWNSTMYHIHNTWNPEFSLRNHFLKPKHPFRKTGKLLCCPSTWNHDPMFLNKNNLNTFKCILKKRY